MPGEDFRTAEERAGPTALRLRKAAKEAERRKELKGAAPLLLSLPWRRIRAGRARVRDISTFLKFYRMYASILGRYQHVLIRARDSRRYRYYDLYASAGRIEVAGIDADGDVQTLLVISDRYWEGEYSPAAPVFTPF